MPQEIQFLTKIEIFWRVENRYSCGEKWVSILSLNLPTKTFVSIIVAEKESARDLCSKYGIDNESDFLLCGGDARYYK